MKKLNFSKHYKNVFEVKNFKSKKNKRNMSILKEQSYMQVCNEIYSMMEEDDFFNINKIRFTIYKTMKELGFTQSEIAKALGVCSRTIRNL